MYIQDHNCNYITYMIKEMNTSIQQQQIHLIKIDSKDNIQNVRNIFINLFFFLFFYFQSSKNP